MELYMARTVRALSSKAHSAISRISSSGPATHSVRAVISPGESIIRSPLEEAGISSISLSLRFRDLPLLAARRLARTIDEAGIEVVHVHWRRDLPLAALAKRFSRARPRLIYTCQMKMSHNKNDPYHNFVYSQVDTILTITQQLREQIRERVHPRFRERVGLLYYGTEPGTLVGESEKTALRERHGLAPHDFTIGLIGQKFEGKGQHLLIDAMARLAGEGLACKALIVGPNVDPPYLTRLEGQIADAGLEAEVTLLDFVNRPQELMQICDCVVLATYQETFGLVLIEAMSVGTAVIGSDAGGVPEIIEDGRSGLLFRTRDSGSLAEKIALLHRDPALRSELAREGRRKAAALFNLEKHYDRLQAVMGGN